MIVPASVVEAVRRHAVEVDAEQPGRESLGVLVLDGDQAVRYTRLHNADPRPRYSRVTHASQLRRRGGLPLVLVHSHPAGDTTPSGADLAYTAHVGLDAFAIYSLATDELKLWRLDRDSVAEAPFEITP